MKILKIVLETANVEKMKDFYSNILEMPIVSEAGNYFTVQAGSTQITFNQTETEAFYHFALRTDSKYLEYMFDKLNKSETELLSDKFGHRSMYWQAKQVYFYDPDGNLVEILENNHPYSNKSDGWYDVCEVGLPSSNVSELSDFLRVIPTDNEPESDTFHFYGDKLGNFVLVKINRKWFPTDHPATIHSTTVEVEGKESYSLKHQVLPYTIHVRQKECE